MLSTINSISSASQCRRKSDMDVSNYAMMQTFKKDPKAFLKKNLLLINNEPTNVPISSGIYYFQLESITDKQAMDHNGKKINCCLLKQVPDYSEPVITAYYLAYKQDAVESSQLANEADYFFTAGLSGCGFAVEDTGYPRVFHIDGEKYPNDKMLDSITEIDNKRLYNDEVYGHDHYYGASSVIGVKNSTGWQLYGQAWYMKSLESYQLAFREGIYLI
ncbi:hypothetical protein [Spartinivicinus ruber]|uniref:hypothetical protein n=1 Tax=Spartinivicinus ruber TaxID=2683272 RepID=UPI0013D76011|nr:hypothetical protein [Spartinivicinus ruber]